MKPRARRNSAFTDYRYLKEINEIHCLAVHRLLGGERKMLPEFAELCEDIGNLYLDVSDEIREDIMSGNGQRNSKAETPQSGQAFLQTHPSEDDGG